MSTRTRPLRLVNLVGARPQFVKAAAVCRAVAASGGAIEEILVHSGQHYSPELSAAIFADLGLRQPDVMLEAGSGTQAQQTASMMVNIEQALLQVRPDVVLVYGDTNTTLAAALAAAKLNLTLVHVESGIRSFNRTMPEEVNRVITDHVMSWGYAPSQAAVENLRAEGLAAKTIFTGDVMYDVLRHTLARQDGREELLARLGLQPGGYALATVHRPANTDDGEALARIVGAFAELAAAGLPVVLPIHPRTQAALQRAGIATGPTRVLPPVTYREMIALQRHARVVLTDSGGMQKEAFWLGVPCVTLRPDTEWPETVACGWNVLVDHDRERIVAAALAPAPTGARPTCYGEGDAAERIVAHLVTL